MDALHEMQKELLKNIKNSYANFKKKGVANMTKVGARTRLNGVEHWYSQFEANHAKILGAAGDERNHDYFKTNLSELITDEYFDKKGEFVQFIEDVELLERERDPPSPPPQMDETISTRQSIDHHSLPKVNLPKFSGLQSQWENFRDLFRSIVHRRNDLDAAVKYVYLRSSLNGEALERIKSFPIAAEHYERALNALMKHYDNKRRTVNNLVLKLFNVQPMKSETASELQRVFMEVSGPLESLKSLGRTGEDLGNDIIVHLFVRQFETNTKKDWKKSIDKEDDTPSTVGSVREFIESQLENLETTEDCRDASCSQNNNAKGKKTRSSKGENDSCTAHTLQAVSKDYQKNFKCNFCGAEHQTYKCDQIIKRSISERQQAARSKNLCFNCLGTKHSTKQCKSRYSCFTCKGRHHTLLHMDKADNALSSEVASISNCNTVSMDAASSNVVASDSFIHTTQSKSAGVLLATAQICIVGPKNRCLVVRALLDSCSQVSLVTQGLSKRLALLQSDTHVCIQGVGDKGAMISDRMANFQLRCHFESDFMMDVEALVLPKLSSYKPPKMDKSSDLEYLKGLNLADPAFATDSRIDVLLGASVYAEVIQQGIVKGLVNQPIALNSKLGWLIFGSVSKALETTPTVLHCACDDGTHLSDLLEGFWRIEEGSTKNPSSSDDQICEEFYTKTTTRDSLGRFIVRLPWKDPEHVKEVPIGLSYPRALRALKRLEATFQKDVRLKDEYSKFMREYLELGHMVEAVGSSSAPDYFLLPHHGVWKESSSTTKLRTVFNGSSKLPTGESLNDLLHVGENLLKSPIDLICCNRNFRIALSSDLEKMFRLILVHENDRKFQAILWRFDPRQKVSVFLLNTVTYGLAPSAFLAIRSLLQLAREHKEEHPVASNVVERDMYSDNVLTGAHSTQEALEKIQDLLALFQKGQMHLRKWASNDKSALANLTPDLLVTDEISLFSQDTAVPILGIAWHTSGDYFLFHLQNVVLESPVTKRSVLSRIARIFDPLGWLGPVIVQAKILMQALWLLKVGWDESLPDSVVTQWSKWVRELPSISQIRIPRWTGFTPQTQIVEIHGFADASKLAYGAVIYLRLIKNAEISISLQIAKSKVAPIKTVSIPRLELCATVLLSRIVKQFIDSTTLAISDVHLWTDSADVLYWLKDHPSRWNVFVANRCSEIHTSLPRAFWHHVKSKNNPADVLSRGISPTDLEKYSLWWKGPEFLGETSSRWSKEQDELNFNVSNIVTAGAYKTIAVLDPLDNSPQMWDLVNQYSNLEKLLRVTAYLLRFIQRVAEKRESKMVLGEFIAFSHAKATHVSAQELENALRLWIYLAQKAHFSPERAVLMAGRKLNGNTGIANLNPFIQNQLIKVGGRLTNQLSGVDSRHPVILSHSCALNPLLIMQAHLRTLHGGTQLTLATLRQRVWILRARTEVRKVIRSCVKCARYAAQTPTQLMGDLPPARVRLSPPFKNTGVDYAGPINVRMTKSRGKGTLKGYISVFVCMATRAVHLELVEDYSSESFIAALHRFTSRRGHCQNMYSDQGTNFVGADKQLQQMLSASSPFYSAVTRQLANEGINWFFNPPSAPHFGGLWEAAVKSLKHHLRRVIGEQVLTFSELSTLLCKIEACLNSRPLVALSDDSADLSFLTPAHFLIQRDSFIVPAPDLTKDKVPLGKRWKHITQLSQHFWSRWSKEYLSSLQKRNKWLTPQQAPAIGDIVLIKHECTPPGKWPMGRITAIHPGSDGLVRVVTVRTVNGTLTRPIVKLIKLPVSSDNAL